MRNVLIVAVGLLVLALLNYAIYSREMLLEQGRIVFLELAPVDPRSLMQGDYMALRYRAARELSNALDSEMPESGYAVLSVDERGVAHFKRVDDETALGASEARMLYRYRNGHIQFATNAFFFQEGTGSDYEPAKYGEFRVDEDGKSILIGMRDEDLQRLGVSFR